MFIDSHCHLTSLNRDRRQQVLESAANEYRFIDSSIDVNSSLASIALSDHYPFVYTALGFHPFNAGGFSEEVITTYESLIDEHKSIVAIGEAGLDYKAEVNMAEQEAVFSQCIRLARRRGLPLMIHNRIDSRRVLEILDNFYPDYERVVFHCFSYGVDFLGCIVDKGGFVSFSLNVLRNNKNIVESLTACPLSNILLETDSPYMKMNNRETTPLDIVSVYRRVSEIKKISLVELEESVWKNAQQMFSFAGEYENHSE